MQLGILGSGAGSNALAVMDAIERGSLDARVACVISDRSEAPLLEHARRRSVPAYHVDASPYKTKLAGTAEARTIALLREHRVEWVLLAGFMRIVKDGLLEAFPQRILNIHPSLLPAFPGLRAWEQALDYGVKITGCTVHLVDQGIDTGRILVQRAVPVFENDTPDTLHRRIQDNEHIAYPEAIRLVMEGAY